MDELPQTQPANTGGSTQKRTGSPKVMYGVVLVAVALLASGGVYWWQHGQVNSLSSQKANLSTSFNSLSNDESNLKVKNSNLSKSLQQLQTQLASENNSSSNGSVSSSTKAQPATIPAAVGKFIVNSVKTEPLSDFDAAGGTTFSSGQDALVVNVTISNLTSSTQSYNLFQFYATTGTGAIVDPTVYGNGFNPGIWNNSQITAGGSQTVNILFTPRTDLTKLSWTPPTGAIVTESLSAPSN